MTNYTKKAVLGVGISLLFGILASITAYLTRIVLSRNLTPTELGLFYAVYTFVMFLLFFRDLGLPTALVKYIAEFKALGKNSSIKTAILAGVFLQVISSVTISIILLIMTKYLAIHYFNDQRAELILYILIAYVFFSVLFVILKAILQAFQAMFWYGSLELVKNIIIITTVTILFAKGYSTLAPAIAFAVVCPIIVILYLPIILKRYNYFSYKITEFKQTTTKLVLFGIPALAISIAGEFISYIDTIILTGTRSLQEVGVYNIILPSALVFVFLGRAISSIILPLSSEFWAKNEKKKLLDGIKILHKYLFLLISPLLLIIVVYSAFFIELFFGQNYLSGTVAMQILLIGILFYVVAAINNNILSGIGKPKIVARIIILAAIVNTVLNLVFIPKYGIVAAASTTSLSYIIMFILSMFSLRKYVQIPYQVMNLFKISLSSVLFFLLLKAISNTLQLNSWLELSLSVGIAGITYIIFTFCVGLFEWQEIKYYLAILKK